MCLFFKITKDKIKIKLIQLQSVKPMRKWLSEDLQLRQVASQESSMHMVLK